MNPMVIIRTNVKYPNKINTGASLLRHCFSITRHKANYQKKTYNLIKNTATTEHCRIG